MPTPRTTGADEIGAERRFSAYLVTEADAPLVGTSEAARLLGVTAQTIRTWVEGGRLPSTRGALRPGSARKPPIRVPRWAVDAELQARQKRSTGPQDEERLRMRNAALEDALVLLGTADEHARRARMLTLEAAAEWEKANAILAEAARGVLAPSSPADLASFRQ